jgi:hypothetical protein
MRNFYIDSNKYIRIKGEKRDFFSYITVFRLKEYYKKFKKRQSVFFNSINLNFVKIKINPKNLKKKLNSLRYLFFKRKKIFCSNFFHLQINSEIFMYINFLKLFNFYVERLKKKHQKNLILSSINNKKLLSLKTKSFINKSTFKLMFNKGAILNLFLSNKPTLNKKKYLNNL